MLKTNKVNNWLVFNLLSLAALVSLQWYWHISPWITLSAFLILFATSWLLLPEQPKASTNPLTDPAGVFKTNEDSRTAGLQLQGLGELESALEKFMQCPQNQDTANLLYNLATDFQLRGNTEKYQQVIKFISTFATNFKDIKSRLQTFETETPKTIASQNEFEDTIVVPHDELHRDDPKLIGYPNLYGSRYKIDSLLGEGTSGAVFKGIDIASNKTIAIKVLNLTREIDSNQLEEYKFRFYREIETAGNLNHPNIVKIFDNGETEGFAYIAMEYIDGINLRHFSRANKLLHPQTILKLVAQCADALSYAHKQKVIHRDIKPANILYNEADDFVKLTDFGIAKIPDSTRTRAGSILGTPLYMSPEQLAGKNLDARSDLYSLGVTLYHLLTGSPPFRPKTMAELMRSITQEQHLDISEVDPNTPACIAWTVNKALEKNPDDRFQSAASMANKLRECEMMLDG